MTNYSTSLKSWGDSGTEYPDGTNYSDGVPPVDEWDDFFNFNVVEDVQHLIGLTNERLDSGSGTSYPTSPTPGELTWRSDTQKLGIYDDVLGAHRELAYQNELDSHAHDGRYYTETESDDRFVNESGDTLTGALTLSDGSTAASQSWVNSNADVPNADYADDAGDADTVDGKHADQLGVTVEEDGTALVSPATAANFTGHLNVIDDGDGTVTIDPTHNHDGRYARLFDGVQAPVYATTGDVPSTISEGEVVYISGDSSLYVEDGT